MVLPTSGPLTFSQIRNEFGGSAPDTLSEYYRGNLSTSTETGSTLPEINLNSKDTDGVLTTFTWDLRDSLSDTSNSVDTSDWNNWANQILRVDPIGSAHETALLDLTTPTFINLSFSDSISATIEVLSTEISGSDVNISLGNVLVRQEAPGVSETLTISQGNYTVTVGVPDLTTGRAEIQRTGYSGSRSNVVTVEVDETITIALRDNFDSGESILTPADFTNDWYLGIDPGNELALRTAVVSTGSSAGYRCI